MLTRIVSKRALRTVLIALGLDEAVAITLIWRAWGCVAVPVTLVLVARCLSPAEQGYYFTFASLIALRGIFEMGLGQVVQQYASHEASALHPGASRCLYGDNRSKERLTSFGRMAMRWYGTAAILFLTLVLPGGCWFFGRSVPVTSDTQWVGPWVTAVAAMAGAFALAPLPAILEGCGYVADVARMRMLEAVFTAVALWVSLLGGLGLWAVAALYLVTVTWEGVWLAYAFGRFFVDLYRTKSIKVDWKSEVLPFQWRVAVSCISGYFVFQLANPVLFKYHGAIVAGQMGMSLAVSQGLLNVSMSWINTRVPRFARLVARSQFADLDRLFKISVLQSQGFLLASSVAVGVVACWLHWTHPVFVKRIVEPLAFILLLLTALLTNYVWALALYLRSHKKDPLYAFAILQGITNSLVAYFLGRSYGALGISAGFAASMLIVALGSTLVFVRSRREWHSAPFSLAASMSPPVPDHSLT